MVFDNLTALGYGIITFAIVIGIGSVVLGRFASSTAECATGFTWNATAEGCVNVTGGDNQGGNPTTVNTLYMNTQLGSTGLAGWTPAIIALVIGMLFLGAFMARGGRSV